MCTRDRFVPNPRYFNTDYSYHKLNHKTNQENFNQYVSTTSIIEQKLDHFSENIYKEKLKSVFGLDHEYRRIVPVLHPSLKSKVQHVDYIDGTWPVNPRRKPCITSPYRVLDLPQIKNDLRYNVLHWDANDYIIAGLDKSVYLWHVPSYSKILYKLQLPTICTSVRSNIDASLLAITSQGSQIRIWNNSTCKITSQQLNCFKYGDVMCIDWHPCNKYLALGYTSGALVIKKSDLKQVSENVCAHSGCIITTLFNPGGNFIATTSYDDQWIKVWTFPELILLYKHFEYYPSRGLSWHPWKNSLLCFGNIDGVLGLINVSLAKLVSRKRTHHENTCIVNISFNKLTAELVTSHVLLDEWSWSRSCFAQLNVLSSFDCLVDRLTGHQGRVLYLQWSPDNQYLATAGSDETLHLWNFLPENKKKKEKLREKDTNSVIAELHNFIR